MPTVPTPPSPGSLTVPPWFGWEDLLGLLLVVVAVGVAAVLVMLLARGGTDRSEWQALLDARSAGRPTAADHDLRPAAVEARGNDHGAAQRPIPLR